MNQPGSMPPRIQSGAGWFMTSSEKRVALADGMVVSIAQNVRRAVDLALEAYEGCRNPRKTAISTLYVNLNADRYTFARMGCK